MLQIKRYGDRAQLDEEQVRIKKRDDALRYAEQLANRTPVRRNMSHHVMNGKPVLDLHEIHGGWENCLKTTDQFLDWLQSNGSYKQATIITGWGNNSPRNIALLKPGVELFLKCRGYKYEKINKGALEVDLMSLSSRNKW